MVNRETNELLDDIMLDNIASMSKEQLKGELNGKVSDLDAIIKRVSTWGTSQKKQDSLSVLQAARRGLESQRERYKKSTIREKLAKSGIDAKGMLIQLLAQGKLPENLTLAFRDGEEFTDNDAEKILDDLVNMGVVKLDDTKD
jgi:inactivated superfamily I helicase